MLLFLYKYVSQKQFCPILVTFYSMLKSADVYLQLIFITGVTKFAQASIFFKNQLIDLSLNTVYETLYGMMATEIQTLFGTELNKMAEENAMSRETVMEQIMRCTPVIISRV